MFLMLGLAYAGLLLFFFCGVQLRGHFMTSTNSTVLLITSDIEVESKCYRTLRAGGLIFCLKGGS